MEVIKSFCKKNVISIIGGTTVLLIIAFFSIQSGCETKQFNQTVDNRSIQANKAVQEAANAQNAAINSSIERQTEDAVREKIIAPKLGEARRRSQNSKAALDAEKQKYSNAKNNISNLSNSDADNCRELSRLFPNVRFEDCQ